MCLLRILSIRIQKSTVNLFWQLTSSFKSLPPPCFLFLGGLKWTRTTDLTLIRRAL